MNSKIIELSDRMSHLLIPTWVYRKQYRVTVGTWNEPDKLIVLGTY